MIRLATRFAALALTAFLVAPASSQMIDTGEGTSSRQPIATPVERTKAEIFEMVNSVRMDNHREPLIANEILDDLAMRRSTEMASAHARDLAPFKGRFEQIRTTNENIEYYGENTVRLMQGIEASGKAMQYFLKDKRYRRNILQRRANLTGIGVYMGSAGEVYITQVFVASPEDTLAEPEEDQNLLLPTIPDLQSSVQLDNSPTTGP